MKKTYWKDSLRDVGKSKGRFIAIIAIVALGAGFFGGIKATSVDMKLTADNYYKECNLYDFRVVSTLGLTQKDGEAIRAMDGVKEVMLSYQADAIIKKENNQDGDLASDSILRLHALPEGKTINQNVLIEGRMPEKPDEAVVLSASSIGSNFQIGDVIQIDLNQDPDMADSLNYTKFTVVGMVNSPLYMSIGKSSTSKGSGSVNNYAFVPEGAFNMEAYTELYLTMDGMEDVSCFSSEYGDLTDSMERRLKDIGVERSEIRKEEVVKEATDKLNDAKKEYNDKKTEADEKLADAQKQLDDAQKELDDGRQKLTDAQQKLADGEKELAEQQKEFDDKVADAQKQFSDAQTELEDKERELRKAKNELEKAKEQLEDGQRSYDTAFSEFSKNEASYQEAKAQFDTVKTQFEQYKAGMNLYLDGLRATLASTTDEATIVALQQEIALVEQDVQSKQSSIDSNEAMLAGIRSQLDDAQAQLAAASSQLASGEREYLDGKRQVEDGEKQLEEGKLELSQKMADFITEKDDAERQLADAQAELEDGRQEIADAEEELADGEKKLADARKEYEDKKAEADEKLSDAQLQIEDAEQEIADIKTPDWYVLDRENDTGYAGFTQDADRIDAIAMVFPVFFFLVAALVCLTTMTRMVEEERGQIGTMKALGYGKGAILEKYVFYAALTSLVGSIIGLAIGFQVFPRVIWAAYGIMYTTPPILTPWNMKYALIATIVFLICTIGSTFVACWGELMSVPANLIRPKPPKKGKRVFLENIPVIWKHLSFTKKLTARNILRYKKRFFMTVIGIAGCTALMLTGFGLKDSINGIVQKQFGELYHYDMQLSFSHEIDPSSPTGRQQQALDALAGDERVTDTLLVHQENAKAHSAKAGGFIDTYVFVPEDTEKAESFITFQERRGKKPISFPEEGVILTEKLARELNLEVGDDILLQDVDNRDVSVKVAAICENYVYHYAYMSPSQYEALYGKNCTYQAMVGTVSGQGDDFQNSLSSDLLQNEEIIGVTYISGITDTFTDIFDRLDLVVIVLIVSASLLAFVVLYNLTNINVNERIREIATIKVLGFYNKEVDSYIYRENIILTFIGILVGFGLGVLLHQYVMRVAEVNIVMFGRDILPLSYLWAGLLTILFAGIVNFVMHFRLKRISMVESLKSVE